jgi:hypothetical protein
MLKTLSLFPFRATAKNFPFSSFGEIALHSVTVYVYLSSPRAPKPMIFAFKRKIKKFLFRACIQKHTHTLQWLIK